MFFHSLLLDIELFECIVVVLTVDSRLYRSLLVRHSLDRVAFYFLADRFLLASLSASSLSVSLGRALGRKHHQFGIYRHRKK